MKKLERDTKILIILILIMIPITIFSIVIGIPFNWEVFWGFLLFAIYQGFPLFFAQYKSGKEEEDIKKNRTEFKDFIAKRLSMFKSLEILSISYSLLFGLFLNVCFTILLAGYQTQAGFFSAIALGIFGTNFLFATYALINYQYLTHKLIYPENLIENFNSSQDIPEELSKYLDQLHTPYVFKEAVRYSLYLHFFTLLPFLTAIRF